MSADSSKVEKRHALPAERIVLHSVRFTTHSDTIDEPSLAVLDAAANIIKTNPNSFIYVDVSRTPNRAHNVVSKRTTRLTRALATYLERKGISGDRLILPSPDAEYATNDIDSQGHTLIVVQIDVTSGQD